jgi:hypothetical protein
VGRVWKTEQKPLKIQCRGISIVDDRESAGNKTELRVPFAPSRGGGEGRENGPRMEERPPESGQLNSPPSFRVRAGINGVEDLGGDFNQSGGRAAGRGSRLYVRTVERNDLAFDRKKSRIPRDPGSCRYKASAGPSHTAPPPRHEAAPQRRRARAEGRPR